MYYKNLRKFVQQFTTPKYETLYFPIILHALYNQDDNKELIKEYNKTTFTYDNPEPSKHKVFQEFLVLQEPYLNETQYDEKTTYDPDPESLNEMKEIPFRDERSVQRLLLRGFHDVLYYALINSSLKRPRDPTDQQESPTKRRRLLGRLGLRNQKHEPEQKTEFKYKSFEIEYKKNNLYSDFTLYVSVYSDVLRYYFNQVDQQLYDLYTEYTMKFMKPSIYVTHLPYRHSKEKIHGKGFQSHKETALYLANRVKSLQRDRVFKNIIVFSEDATMMQSIEKRIFQKEHMKEDPEGYENAKGVLLTHWMFEEMRKHLKNYETEDCKVNVIRIGYITNYLIAHGDDAIFNMFSGLSNSIHAFRDELEERIKPTPVHNELMDLFQQWEPDRGIPTDYDLYAWLYDSFYGGLIYDPVVIYDIIDEVLEEEEASDLKIFLETYKHVKDQREYITSISIQKYIEEIKNQLTNHQCDTELAKILPFNQPLNLEYIIANLYEFYVVFGGLHQFHRWNTYLQSQPQFDFVYRREYELQVLRDRHSGESIIQIVNPTIKNIYTLNDLVPIPVLHVIQIKPPININKVYLTISQKLKSLPLVNYIYVHFGLQSLKSKQLTFKENVRMIYLPKFYNTSMFHYNDDVEYYGLKQHFIDEQNDVKEPISYSAQAEKVRESDEKAIKRIIGYEDKVLLQNKTNQEFYKILQYIQRDFSKVLALSKGTPFLLTEEPFDERWHYISFIFGMRFRFKSITI
jgi:hypothetical protein